MGLKNKFTVFVVVFDTKVLILVLVLGNRPVAGFFLGGYALPFTSPFPSHHYSYPPLTPIPLPLEVGPLRSS